MNRSPKNAMRTVLTAAAIVATSLTGTIATAHAATTIYRCEMPDGSVVFADSRCKSAVKVSKWSPDKLPLGIQMTDPGAQIGPMMPISETPITIGRVDPYVDCKARGGTFRVAARLCILPSKSTRVKRID